MHKREHIIQFFEYGHLKSPMKEISQSFAILAQIVINDCPKNPERTVALRKLLEAKDAAVRSMVADLSKSAVPVSSDGAIQKQSVEQQIDQELGQTLSVRFVRINPELHATVIEARSGARMDRVVSETCNLIKVLGAPYAKLLFNGGTTIVMCNDVEADVIQRLEASIQCARVDDKATRRI